MHSNGQLHKYQILCRVHRTCGDSSAKGLITGTVYLYLKNENLCEEKCLNSSATDTERISPPKEDKCITEMFLELLAAFWNFRLLQVSELWDWWYIHREVTDMCLEQQQFPNCGLQTRTPM